MAGDDKDWTWVLDRRCPDCGLDAGAITLADVPGAIRAQIPLWPEVLHRPDVRERPDPGTWSTLEYAAHVRDVFEVFAGRLNLMLTEDDPLFPNWDQDAAAVAGRYGELEPHDVSLELQRRGASLASDFDAVTGEQATRSGLRSNGSVFTVLTLAQYLIHDLVHHAWDVTQGRAGHEGGDVAASPARTDPGAASAAGVVPSANDLADGGPSVVEDGSVDGTTAEAGPAVDGEPSAEAAPQKDLPPIQRFAHEHRLAVGLTLGVLALALAVLFAVATPDSDAGGFSGFVTRWASSLCWLLVSGVAVSWALRAKRTTTNGLAWLGIACYACYLFFRAG
ncbi:DinB family protein [Ruania sp. N2-46]|uniref:DinB family protein n=1 Tax=Occultella gossypii TaxID=2800820 RepID=A0ABS7S6B3_9MICO|nr:DinB family protein [Occultella gossypii]